MKKSLLLALGLALAANTALARDDIDHYNIAELLETTKAKNALLDVPLYFGSQAYGEVQETYGEVTTNQKNQCL